MDNNKYAIILAGGESRRMHSKVPKPLMSINGKFLLCYSLESFVGIVPISNIILVINNKHKGLYIILWFNYPEYNGIKKVIGGKERFDSVKNALAALPDDGLVAIHDAARPYVPKPLIRKGYKLAKANNCAIPYHKTYNSVRIKDDDKNLIVDRDDVMLIDTPQFFNISLLKQAYEQDYNDKFTDDASVWESKNLPLTFFEGTKLNLKITYPEDLILMSAILENFY
ncbi:MAG: IspD/TarI family cytidylyltransferase [Bacteroidales bacterium]|jgi:2-C-methyl-D-erythritol 4-phosphate cytidylyltransferase|nr:IspD/TarI family cytidylyltransferase [Bacteroidales bacterium]